MKKKIYAFLLVLVSVIACVVCLAACNSGEAHPVEYVGEYEFVSLTVEVSFNGGEPDKSTIEVGTSNVDKNFISLNLSEDGTYEIIMSPSYMNATGAVGTGSGTLSGKWSVSGGKLNLDGSGYGNGILADDFLTFATVNNASYGGNTMSAKQELKLKKVVAEAPAV